MQPVSRNSKNAVCPVCRRPAVAEQLPFCSLRCRDRDLLQWLGDGYALPGPPADNMLDNGDGQD